jgi:hypothetical protein
MKLRYAITLIVIMFVVIAYKAFRRDKEVLFSFERKYLSENIHRSLFGDLSFLMTEKGSILQTDSILLNYTRTSKQDSIYTLRMYNMKNNTLNETSICLTTNQQIEYNLHNDIYYTDKLKLFRKTAGDHHASQIIVDRDIVEYRVYPLRTNGCIFLGTSKQNDLYETGFYKLSNGNPVCIKVIDINKDSTFLYRNRLVYSGGFVGNDNYLLFYCDKIPSIYIFTLEGEFIKSIFTKENVPKPIIDLFKDVYIYKRGYTFNTIIGVHEYLGNLYVLSYRCAETHVVIDKYSIKTGEYLGSIQVNEVKMQNKEIKNVFGIGNIMILNAFNNEIIKLEL